MYTGNTCSGLTKVFFQCFSSILAKFRGRKNEAALIVLFLEGRIVFEVLGLHGKPLLGEHAGQQFRLQVVLVEADFLLLGQVQRRLICAADEDKHSLPETVLPLAFKNGFNLFNFFRQTFQELLVIYLSPAVVEMDHLEESQISYSVMC